MTKGAKEEEFFVTKSFVIANGGEVGKEKSGLLRYARNDAAVRTHRVILRQRSATSLNKNTKK